MWARNRRSKILPHLDFTPLGPRAKARGDVEGCFVFTASWLTFQSRAPQHAKQVQACLEVLPGKSSKVLQALQGISSSDICFTMVAKRRRQASPEQPLLDGAPRYKIAQLSSILCKREACGGLTYCPCAARTSQKSLEKGLQTAATRISKPRAR